MLTRRVWMAAQFGEILGRVGGNKNANGIKEALQIGLVNAIGLASRPDGYFANELIKILMPEKLRQVEKGLRFIGAAKLIDEFVLGMNRAAENAAPLAKSIFLDALKQMSITDAVQLVKGGDKAATDYFRKSTGEKLVTAFRPPISASLQSVGAVKSYEAMMGRFKSIPFVRAETMDVDGYVTGKAVEGLFLLVGEEEKKIRKNPAARITPLLRDVFGGR